MSNLISWNNLSNSMTSSSSRPVFKRHLNTVLERYSLEAITTSEHLQLRLQFRIFVFLLHDALYRHSEFPTHGPSSRKRLQAFHMQYQRRILGIRWSDFVTNSSVAKKTGLPDIRAVIGDRRLALFGHVRCLSEGALAHDALQVSVELLAGTT